MSKKRIATVGLFAAFAALAACKPEVASTEPVTPDITIVAQGELVKGKMWDAPPASSPRTYANFYAGHITIYSNDLVIIQDSDGKKHAAPLEWCSELVFK